MTTRENEYNKYLEKIVDNLDISRTMRDKAISSYKAVGNWLGGIDDTSVKISPQGSFYLGTVIKPVSDKDEYDIDLVCLLENRQESTEYDIKNLVGDRIKEHGTYKKMLDDKEGKRCWTLHYDEFHMDVLPSVPKYNFYLEPHLTTIRLTDKVSPNNYAPKYGDPYSYHKWFEERMQTMFLDMRGVFAEQNQVEISEVPLYEIKTPLQRAIQLLKRHRDIMYQNESSKNKANAPISIIITTLAAHAYDNETNIYGALQGILKKMANFIERRGDEYWVQNPVMHEENFAEKWNVDANKQTQFMRWLEQAKKDILDTPFNEYGIHKLSSSLEHSFGSNIVKKSVADLGNETKMARDNGSLYISGLTGGLTTTVDKATKKVGGHTFFGT